MLTPPTVAQSKQRTPFFFKGLLFVVLPEASCFQEILTEGFAAGFGHLIIRRGHEF